MLPLTRLIRTPGGTHWHVIRNDTGQPFPFYAALLCGPHGPSAKTIYAGRTTTMRMSDIRPDDTVCGNCARIIAARTEAAIASASILISHSTLEDPTWVTKPTTV